MFASPRTPRYEEELPGTTQTVSASAWQPGKHSEARMARRAQRSRGDSVFKLPTDAEALPKKALKRVSRSGTITSSSPTASITQRELISMGSFVTQGASARQKDPVLQEPTQYQAYDADHTQHRTFADDEEDPALSDGDASELNDLMDKMDNLLQLASGQVGRKASRLGSDNDIGVELAKRANEASTVRKSIIDRRSSSDWGRKDTLDIEAFTRRGSAGRVDKKIRADSMAISQMLDVAISNFTALDEIDEAGEAAAAAEEGEAVVLQSMLAEKQSMLAEKEHETAALRAQLIEKDIEIHQLRSAVEIYERQVSEMTAVERSNVSSQSGANSNKKADGNVKSQLDTALAQLELTLRAGADLVGDAREAGAEFAGDAMPSNPVVESHSAGSSITELLSATPCAVYAEPGGIRMVGSSLVQSHTMLPIKQPLATSLSRTLPIFAQTETVASRSAPATPAIPYGTSTLRIHDVGNASPLSMRCPPTIRREGKAFSPRESLRLSGSLRTLQSETVVRPMHTVVPPTETVVRTGLISSPRLGVPVQSRGSSLTVPIHSHGSSLSAPVQNALSTQPSPRTTSPTRIITTSPTRTPTLPTRFTTTTPPAMTTSVNVPRLPPRVNYPSATVGALQREYSPVGRSPRELSPDSEAKNHWRWSLKWVLEPEAALA